MNQLKKATVPSRRISMGLTFLVLGLVLVGSLCTVGSWAWAGTNSGATPTLSDAYGEQFLLTNSQIASQHAAPQETNSDVASEATVSPLKNWSYTRTLRHVSPAH
jgi:hypothetical protein